MGGKRFKDQNTVRVPAVAFEGLQKNICAQLEVVGLEPRVPFSMPGKESHGDIDIIVAEEQLLTLAPADAEPKDAAHLARLVLQEVLGAEAMTRSGALDHATSYLVPFEGGLFQLDIITHPLAVIDYAHRFYSWGDAGAMVAMQARALGLRNKAVGLHYVGGSLDRRADLLLISDYDQALELLGLDPAIHAAGFATAEEVYRWLASGKYFNADIFAADRQTAKNRRRSQLRPMIVQFRDWIAINRPMSRIDAPRQFNEEGLQSEAYLENRQIWKQRWEALFPEIISFEEELEKKFEQKQNKDAFIAVEKVAESSGLSGESLRILMWQLTKDEGYFDIISRRSEDELQQLIERTMRRTESV